MKKVFMNIYFGIRKVFGDARRWRLARSYYRARGRHIDFDNPTDLSGYVMSGIFYERNNSFAPYADKVAVKDYVTSKGLGHIVPKCYGVWDDAAKVDFDSLPEKFAIKCNHGCGYNFFCRDRSTFDFEGAREMLGKWLVSKFVTPESHYDHIPPRIYAEELLEDAGNFPVDYRIFCIHGRPVVIDATICPDNDQTKHFPHYIFDTDWNYMPRYASVIHDDWKRLPKPENFDKMMEYARILSKDFEFVRVDLYNFDGKIWFSELTFTPSAGRFGQFNDLAVHEMYQKLTA